MNLAIESYIPVKRLGLEAGLRTIAQSGFNAVDFTFYFELEELVNSDNYLETAYGVRQLMDQLGLHCAQAHAPFSFCYNDNVNCSNHHFRNIVRSMQAASVLGAKIIVVHAPAAPAGECAHNLILRLYRALIPYCRQYAVRVGIENLGNALSTAGEMNALLAELDENYFTVCFDIGHANMLGIAPQDYILQLPAGWLGALHVHDNDGTDDQHQIPYRGTVDWDAVIDALRQTNYCGDFTMEAWRFLDDFPNELLQDAIIFESHIASALANRLSEQQGVFL